ncbi:uncharacterized mitochondrial protein AtMg00810-like [Solanum lycopersicum]|uniref:uncharacterized mitochondrial protein AtMg00810-like n=1 Tax=Solanum lycopersicum TaxID=4081 RepID=UPI00374945EB
MIATQFNATVKEVKTDNEGEFISTSMQDFFKAYIINRLPSQTLEEKSFYEAFFGEDAMYVLSLAAQHNWFVHQLDIYNAFLQGDLHDDVYMQLPEGFHTQGESGLVCELVKSLYGLKQASRQWNLKLSEALLESDFVQSSLDHSLFIKRKGSDMVVILVYVDDMLVTGSNLRLIEHTKAILHKAFKIKDLGELKFFWGMEFSRSVKGILMNQMKYALKIISDLGLGNAKPAWTPLEANIKLTIQELDCLTGELDDELSKDKEQYQRLIGKMLYLTMTRLDIFYSIQTFSQFLHQPKRSHWEVAVRVMKYIKREPGLGILLSSKRVNKLNVYCDADWAACPNTRRLVSGFLAKHGETLLSWKSKKQNVVSRSSAKAEYKSMTNAISELV